MSRIGKLPVIVPQGVDIDIKGSQVKVTGPKGSLVKMFDNRMIISKVDSTVLIHIKGDSDMSKALQGTTRAIICNMVKGVSVGWEKRLELVGTGYRAEVLGKTLSLTVGFSHPVQIDAPEGIDFKVEKLDVIVSGVDREIVGQIGARIRAVRPPEPYKGKGIRYKGEIIRRKAGKAAKTAGAA